MIDSKETFDIIEDIMFRALNPNTVRITVSIDRFIKFRLHKGSLDESMKTVKCYASKESLIKDMQKYHPWIEFEELKIEKYVYDDRINWDTHIVTIPGYGVIGFTDGEF